MIYKKIANLFPIPKITLLKKDFNQFTYESYILTCVTIYFQEAIC